MSTFADSHVNARFPARYRDARTGLRFRVVDVTEEEAPDVLVTTEIGEGLLAAPIWDQIAVTADIMKTWGVSIDEAMATAIANIDALDVTTSVKEAGRAKIHMKGGNPWVSSLIVSESRNAESEDGFLMAIPHPSVMITTPVVGAETVSGLEIMMGLCDELFEIDGDRGQPVRLVVVRRQLLAGDRPHRRRVDRFPAPQQRQRPLPGGCHPASGQSLCRMRAGLIVSSSGHGSK